MDSLKSPPSTLYSELSLASPICSELKSDRRCFGLKLLAPICEGVLGIHEGVLKTKKGHCHVSRRFSRATSWLGVEAKCVGFPLPAHLFTNSEHLQGKACSSRCADDENENYLCHSHQPQKPLYCPQCYREDRPAPSIPNRTHVRNKELEVAEYPGAAADKSGDPGIHLTSRE